jgi:hypothetical protein
MMPENENVGHLMGSPGNGFTGVKLAYPWLFCAHVA